MEQQAIPAGYKQTEVGLIPEDWEVKAGAELFIKIQDGTHFSPRLGGNDFLYITSKNIRFGSLDLTNVDYIDTKQHESIYRRCDVRFDDILLTKDGANTGNAAINPLKEQFSLLSSVAFLRLDDGKSVPQFFLQQILSSTFQRQMQDEMSGNAITRLTLNKINKLKFYAPAKKEQEAISSTLSDADALIASLEKLIAKKRAIKTAAMQQLLTGKKRLPGFDLHPNGELKGYKQTELGEVPEDWETGIIEDYVEKIVGGGTPSRTNPDFWKGQVPWATVKDFSTFDPVSTQEYISSKGLQNSASNLVPARTLILSTRMSVGKVLIYQVDVAINQDLKAIFPRQMLNAIFLYFWFNLNQKIFEELGSGSTVKGITLVDLKATLISLPPVEEQAAIAVVLSDMDKELAALEKRLAKTRQVKQGMMQALLTGRVRLV